MPSPCSAIGVLLLVTSVPAISAGELHVIASGTLVETFSELVPAFERATQNRLVVAFGASVASAPDSVQKRLERGERADVIILAKDGLNRLMGRNPPARQFDTDGNRHASLILGKLASYPRQNGLAQALRELGRIERTLFTLDWIQNPELRQRATIGLNKGEARNTLARAVFFHRRGAVRDRLREDLQNKASGLNVAVAAIILWNTVYLQKAVQMLADEGTPVPQECAALVTARMGAHQYDWRLRLEPAAGQQRSRNCARFAGIGCRPREPYRTARRPLEAQAVLSVQFSPFGAAWPSLKRRMLA